MSWWVRSVQWDGTKDKYMVVIAFRAHRDWWSNCVTWKKPPRNYDELYK